MTETMSKTAMPKELADSAAPIIAETPVVKCPSCGSIERVFFADGYDYELLTCKNYWSFHRCLECQLIRLHPRPATEALPVIYPPNYYSYEMESQLSSFALRGKQLLDSLKFRSILNATSDKPASYLEIGCGSGRYLRLMESKGIDKKKIFGLELSRPAVEKLVADGYQVFNQRVEDCQEIAPESLDLVTLFHVIEHVDNPKQVIERIATWLAPGGILALETPNLNSSDARWFKSTYWGGYHFPRHWTLFEQDSLQKLLDDCGFETVSIKYQTGHSFWMYSIHHLLKYQEKSNHPGLARWFDPVKGLPMLILFTGWDILRKTLGFKTSAMLFIAKRK